MATQDPFSRRRFLQSALAAGALAPLGGLALSACSSSSTGGTSTGTSGTTPGGSPGTSVLPNPKDAPFDTVVVIMMENRSFDSLLGWLPGADGKQAGLTYLDKNNQPQSTWHLAPNWQGCQFQDPFHTTAAVASQWNNGKMDGFLTLQPVGDHFPIGYYEAADLPVLAALSQGYTTLDRYFSSMLGPTWPNRFYAWSGTTDVFETGFYPQPGQTPPSNLTLTIWDRLAAAGLSGTYYNNGEPTTGLYASGKYTNITKPYSQLAADASAGKLANFTWIDPDFTTEAEMTGTSNDYHPYGSVQKGEAFLLETMKVLQASPQWDRMVVVINFDEHGGFFDHVPPPACQDDTTGPANLNLKNLGVRVPCVVAGPFAPKRVVSSGPYEHCSVLRMVEWRWGLEPMAVRDRTANNLAEVLDFSQKRAAMTLPTFTPAAAETCTNPNHLP